MKTLLLPLILVLFSLNLSANPTLGKNDLSSKQDLRRWSGLLKQSDQIFTEGWAVLFGRGRVPSSNVFREVRKLLAGGKEGVCQIQIVKNSSKIGSSFELEVCEKLASWQALSNREAVLTMYAGAMRQGIGNGLAALGQPVVCNLSWTASDVLEKLDCSYLGQNLERTVHVKFHEFKYTLENERTLTLKGDRYKDLTDRMDCDSEQPCRIMEVPMSGRIRIVENQIFKNLLPPDSPATKVSSSQPVGGPRGQKEEKQEQVKTENVESIQPQIAREKVSGEKEERGESEIEGQQIQGEVVGEGQQVAEGEQTEQVEQQVQPKEIPADQIHSFDDGVVSGNSGVLEGT